MTVPPEIVAELRLKHGVAADAAEHVIEVNETGHRYWCSCGASFSAPLSLAWSAPTR